MLTSSVLKILGTFFIFFLAGMVFGNVMFLYLSTVPLLVAVFALALEKPRDVRTSRTSQSLFVWVNEEAEITGKIEVDNGFGIVTAADSLPKHFKLVEGNNFRVFWKGSKSLTEELRYKVKCTRRGIYTIGPLNYECRHFSKLRQTAVGSGEDHVELVVRQKPLNVRRMRDPRVVSRIPLPLGSVSRLGMITTDFREIREYAYGDSYRHVNWKATARLMGPLRSRPLVNEFEREGKKVVWVFLDASSAMGIGTTIDNAFEYAVQAVTSFAQFYLARNCYIGLYVYNDGSRLLIPDAGKRQEYKIIKETLRIEISTSNEPLKKAVENCRGHLLGTDPFFIIITMVRKENLQQLIDGIQELRKYSKAVRRQPQILVLHVMGYSIAAKSFYENAGAILLEMENQSAVRALRRAGAFVVPWNPRRQSLMSLMVLGMKRR